MNNENIINCPECGAALDIDNVLFHQLEEKAKKSLQDEYNAKIKDLKNSLEEKFDQKEEKLKVREKDFLLKMEKLESDQENYNVTLNAKVKDETAKAQIQLEKQIKKELIKPTKIYVKELNKINKKKLINGCANITGGGLLDNLIRVVPENLCLNIDLSKIKIKSIFKWLRKNNIKDTEMLKTFNCGVGFCLITNKRNESKIKKIFSKEYQPYQIGFISKEKSKIKTLGKLRW